MTWNVKDYLCPGATEEDRERCAKVPEVIQAQKPHLLCLQEIMCSPAQLEQLADKVGMHCRVSSGRTSQVALDPGKRGRGVAIMWDPHVVPVARSLRTFEESTLYVGMVVAELLVEGVPIVAANTHLPPRLLDARRDEARLIASYLWSLGKHVIACADWNNTSGARRPNGELYDNPPYAQLPWRPDFVTTCNRVSDTKHYVDREPMDILESGGLLDVPALIDAPPHRTVGHWDSMAIDDRVDVIRATKAIARTATSAWSIDTDLTQSISDHLPGIAEFDLGRLTSDSN